MFPLITIIGNEKKGISKFIKKNVTENLRINSNGMQNSLNVSVATGIVTQDLIRKNPN